MKNVTTIDTTQPGTSPEAWAPITASMPRMGMSDLMAGRLVVVAPHPDDETLGAGGIIYEVAQQGVPIVIVSVTDGEAAATADTHRLGSRRLGEVRSALRQLVPNGIVRTVRCGLPDGQVASCHGWLNDILRNEIRPTDLVLTTLPTDGHSDHEAVGSAVGVAARRRGAHVGFFPIWAWHWDNPESSVISRRGRRIDLSPAAQDAKANALKCFVTQTSGSNPILPDHVLRRFVDGFEVVVTGGELR